MAEHIERRQFLKAGAAASAGLVVARAALGQEEKAMDKPVRVGFVGVGGRGTGLLRLSVQMKGILVPAVCDINLAAAARAQAIVEKTGQKRPEAYTKGDEDFRRLMDRDDLDATLIATPWEWHTPMSVYSMKAGKYAACEVPCALTLDECWALVDTCERTRVPMMMLENWSFRRDNLAVLNMIRKGLLGDIIHCHCAHSHNCMHWYFDGRGYPRWGGKHLLRRDCDLYPTHSLGPVLSWMDINVGDRIDYLCAVSTAQRGITGQLIAKYGKDHPPAKLKYRQGDIVTSICRTVRGKTLVVNNDMQTPRPYDNRWEIEGTNGLYNEQRSAVYIHGVSPRGEAWEPFGPYQAKYDHRWWKDLRAAGGHGGTDTLELQQFYKAVRERGPTPIDVYDSVVMSVVFPLSEQSIAGGSRPVKCPDFTRGRWRTRKPYFALDV